MSYTGTVLWPREPADTESTQSLQPVEGRVVGRLSQSMGIISDSLQDEDQYSADDMRKHIRFPPTDDNRRFQSMGGMLWGNTSAFTPAQVAAVHAGPTLTHIMDKPHWSAEESYQSDKKFGLSKADSDLLDRIRKQSPRVSR